MMNINHQADGELNRNETINKILYFIKNENDYKNAAKVVIDNNLTINALNKKTIKLSQLEIAKLTDSIIESRPK